MLTINETTCMPGEKKQVIFHPMGMDYEIPTTLICGAKEGMTMLVTSQIHSGEYNGSAAVTELAKEIDPQKLTGNLILMHVVNSSGFWARSHRFVPEDRVNLNANYPGSPMGTVGNKIAAWFVQEVFPKVDFIADLHGGKDNDLLAPCIFYPRAEKVTKTTLAAAKCLNTRYLLASNNSIGHYGYAAWKMDIPAMILERGYGCVLKKEWYEGHMDSIRLLMNHFHMYDLDKEIHCEPQIDFKKSAYLTIDRKGIWWPAVVPEQDVKKGELLGEIKDYFGNVISSYYAEGDGRIIYMISGMVVHDGDEVVAYGLYEGCEQ